MPITPFLGRQKFDQETTRIMGTALEMACVALRIGDCADDVKQAIANKIIALAKAGERNPDALCEQVLKDIRTEASSRVKPQHPSPSQLSNQPVPPLCPECGQPRELVRTTPRLGTPAEIFGFYCAPCNTIEVTSSKLA